MTTVQDLGRGAQAPLGVSPSGAMDSLALRLANVLVSNDEQAAGLEITLSGPELLFPSDAVVAVTGALASIEIDGIRHEPWTSFLVEAGSRLSIGGCLSGCRAYLAVQGGIDVPIVMGSRSTFIRGGYGGMEGRALRAGDRLPIGRAHKLGRGIVRRRIPPRYIPDYAVSRPIRFIPGPQAEYFLGEAVDMLASSVFKVTPQSDRMGYRLMGRPLERREKGEMLSDFIVPGAIQVPPDGQPIILMADCQVTGGYPKIGVAASVDLSYAAQKKPGDTISFCAIGVKEAQALWRQREQLMKRFRLANRLLSGDAFKR